MEAEIEEILEITARLTTEIERRQALIDFGRERFNRKHDTLFHIELNNLEEEVEDMRSLVERALMHCAVTSQ